MTLSIPSLCVITGHAYAGGLLFAMCHDFRVMKTDCGELWLSEISADLSFPSAYN